jgi:hypothetical protein
MSGMQHNGGVVRQFPWPGSWPPPSDFEDSTAPCITLKSCKVLKIYNLGFKKVGEGAQTGFLRGKKTTDQLLRMCGVTITITDQSEVSAFNTHVEPFFAGVMKSPDYLTVSIEHASEGSGSTYTFWGSSDLATSAAAHDSSNSRIGDHPLQEGDLVTITTKGQSLFIRELTVTGAIRTKNERSIHASATMQHAPAVNVDGPGGFCDNIEKARIYSNIKEVEKVKEIDPDVEDDEWD